MKLSELIAQLQKTLNENGDCEARIILVPTSTRKQYVSFPVRDTGWCNILDAPCALIGISETAGLVSPEAKSAVSMRFGNRRVDPKNRGGR